MTGLRELRARETRLQLRPGFPLVMGIVNTNRGSFSDDRHLATLEEQLDHALRLVEDGADLIDVGADSGVTYDEPVPVERQVDAVVPLIEALAERGIVVSIDTARFEVAEAALGAGASIVNDVSGLADTRLAELCQRWHAVLVLLHTRAGHKQEHFPAYRDVVADVEVFLRERIEHATNLGLDRTQLLIDPGIDYAKLPHESVEVLQAYDRMAAIGPPILSGVSRKYFAGVITGSPPPERLPETLATVEAVRAYPGIVRVHDVAAVRRYLDVAEVLDGSRPFPSYDLEDETLKWVRSSAGPSASKR